MKSAFKMLIQNLAALVKVKSIVTFAVIGCLCVLVIRQNTQITSEMFAAVISSVITYFFTKSADKVTSSASNSSSDSQKE